MLVIPCILLGLQISAITAKLEYNSDKSIDAPLEGCYYNPQLKIESPLRVGAWNAQRLGEKKVMNGLVAKKIAEIILRYDILAIQEVTDKTEENIKELLLIVNELYVEKKVLYDEEDYLKEPLHGVYDVLISDRVGRSKSYQEQYAVFYRTDKVSVNASMNYHDEKDSFAYDPFIVVFNTSTLSIAQLPIITIHTSPKNATYEIDALIDVYEDIVANYNIKDAIIMGDFNAGCDYVNSKDWPHLKLFHDDRFQWLISDHVDTTVKWSTCPYDRIVVAGENLKQIVYEDSAHAYHFDEDLNIKEKLLLKNISDHFPVEVLLKSKTKTKLETELRVTVASRVPNEEAMQLFKICQETMDLESVIRENLAICEEEVDMELLLDDIGYDLNHLVLNETCIEAMNSIFEDLLIYKKSVKKCFGRPTYMFSYQHTSMLAFPLKTLKEIYELLSLATNSHPCLFSKEMISILKYKLERGVMRDASLFLESKELKRLEYFCIFPYSLCSLSVAMPLDVA